MRASVVPSFIVVLARSRILLSPPLHLYFIGGMIPALEEAFADFVENSIVDAVTDGKRKKAVVTKARSPAKKKAARDEHGEDALEETADDPNKSNDQTNLDAAFAESVNAVLDAGTDGKRKGKNARSSAKRKAGRNEHGDDATDKDDQNKSLCGETARDERAAGRKGRGDAVGDDGSARKPPAKTA